MNHKYLILFLSLLTISIDIKAKDVSDDDDEQIVLKAKPNFLKLTRNDITMTLGGDIREDLFFYNSVRTLRNDYSDQNNFVRHRMSIDFMADQGTKHFGKPSSEFEVRLTNYVYWQQNGVYLPFSKHDLRSLDFNSTILTKDVTVKTLIPLIFVEQAWAKCNFDAFCPPFKKNPTFLQAGFFKYTVGRGIALGFHNDMAVDYLGWPGEGDYTRYPSMPPGILFHTQLRKDLSAELYWMKWTSVSASLDQVLEPTRAQRLDAGPGRGCNKDRSNYVIKFDYTPQNTPIGDVHIEPYAIYTSAPEQQIEFQADASAYLGTFGAMFDCEHGNFNFNVEIAGQFGHQTVHSIDRNVKILGDNGATFSHIVYDNALGTVHVPVRNLHLQASGKTEPENQLDYVVNLPINRNINSNGAAIKNADGTDVKIDPTTGQIHYLPAGGSKIFNSNRFGNQRIRPSYRLDYQSFMGVADASYRFEKWPYKITAAVGYIGGDSYPYNDETSRTFHGFIPMRSRYQGYLMENFLIFDRLVLPRPLNIANRSLFAYNDLKDLSNLQFLGLGITWYPMHNPNKCFFSTNIWALWEVASLKKWDPYGHHPNAGIENQIAYDRAFLGFPGVPRTYAPALGVDGTNTVVGNSGWLSNHNARNMLGVEIDLRANYNFIDHASAYALFSLFLPGGLYRDLEGQPNIATRHVDTRGLSHYDSLGSEPAFAIVAGFNYTF